MGCSATQRERRGAGELNPTRDLTNNLCHFWIGPAEARRFAIRPPRPALGLQVTVGNLGT